MRRAHRNSVIKLEECQAAAKRSRANQQAVQANMSSVYTHVGAAQAGSSLARRVVQPVRNNRFWDAENTNQSMSGIVPMYLGHLTLGLPQERRSEFGLVRTEFMLPGAMESPEPDDEQPDDQEQVPQVIPTIVAAQCAQVNTSTSKNIFAALDNEEDQRSPRGKSAGSAGFGGFTTNSRPRSSSDPSKSRESNYSKKVISGVISGAINQAQREQEMETPSIQEHSEFPDSRGVDRIAELDEFEGCGSATPSTLHSDDGEGEESDDNSEVLAKRNPDWPPRGPLQRFKGVLQFSEAFKRKGEDGAKSSTEARGKKAAMESLFRRAMWVKEAEVADPILNWLNKVFALTLRTDFQVTSGFPLVLLIVLDAIYPERVKWCRVDWNIKYQNAVYKNYAMLMVLWKELNMERAREFREGAGAALELEGMPMANLADKLEFLRLVKHWFDQRIYSTHSTYDALERREEYIRHCRMWGHAIKVPSWVKYEERHKTRRSAFSRFARAYECMPEYRRLIWFLGSPEHQNM